MRKSGLKFVSAMLAATALAGCGGREVKQATEQAAFAGTEFGVSFQPIAHGSNPQGHHAMLIEAAADPRQLPEAARVRCAGIPVCSVSGWRDPSLRIHNGDFRADQAEAVVFEFRSSSGGESWRWRCDYHSAENCSQPADLDGNGVIGGHPIASAA